jgi:2'-5' RNA ligase
MAGSVRRRTRVVGVVLRIPDRLGRLANRVRRYYDPNFALIGPHVTVLPPRAVRLGRREVVQEVRRIARLTPPLTLSLGPVRSFVPAMPVVFASLDGGTTSLLRLHRRLCSGPLRGIETFPYVPHLTLGQGLDSIRHRRALARSRILFTRSQGYSWRVDRLIIVERLTEMLWIPLPPILLNSGMPAQRNRESPGNPPRRPGH